MSLCSAPNAGDHKEIKKISGAALFCALILAIAVFAMQNLSLKEMYMMKAEEIHMTKLTAKGTRELKKWEEKTYSEIQGGPKLTTSTVINSLQGDIEGEAKLEYLMMYRADGSATCVGLEQVTGRLGDRSGSFVL